METKLLKFDDSLCETLIKNGEVLAFPTETVFGLGVVYDSKEAFDNLCNVKKRKPDKPFTIMLSKKEDIALFVDLNDKMKNLIDKFMPGEVTFLFPVKGGLYPWVTLNHKTVGIRISASKDVRNLIKRVNKPMLVTSANMSGEETLLTSEEVYEKFNKKIPAIVEGVCESNIASTIVLIGEELKLIRQGGVLFEDIVKEWEK